MWTPGAVDFFRILNEQAGACVEGVGIATKQISLPAFLSNSELLLKGHRCLPLAQVAVVAGVNRDVMLLRVGQVRSCVLKAWRIAQAAAAKPLPAVCLSAKVAVAARCHTGARAHHTAPSAVGGPNDAGLPGRAAAPHQRWPAAGAAVCGEHRGWAAGGQALIAASRACMPVLQKRLGTHRGGGLRRT